MEASDSSNNRGRLPTLAKAPLSVTISCRNEALTIRSLLQATPSKPFFDHHRARCIRNTPSNQPQVSNAVSRRNARERKRVKLVNLGFANLRDHVPAGTKTKKLSKVETLRAAINYIRQLQGILGDRDYGDILSPSTTPGIDIQEDDLDDNSSTSEEGLAFKDFMQAAGGSLGGSENTMSPASSTESSLVHSPYGRRDIAHEEPQLMDISSWFT